MAPFSNCPGDIPLAIQLVILGHRLTHLIERRLSRHRYNHTQAAIIMALARRSGLMAQDLVAHVRVEPPNVTRALQALERRGLICRQPHPTDGRASILSLTEAGEEGAGAIARLVREVSAELEAELAPDQLEAMRTALVIFLSQVEQMREVAV